jgi:hypothetical protein
VRGWLDETRPSSATFFPKHPSPGFALGITLLVSVPVIVLMSSVTTAPEDLAAGGVALLILCVSVAWWMRERSRAQAASRGACDWACSLAMTGDVAVSQRRGVVLHLG